MRKEFEFIKGFTFRICESAGGGYDMAQIKEAMDTLKESTALDTAIIMGLCRIHHIQKLLIIRVIICRQMMN